MQEIWTLVDEHVAEGNITTRAETLKRLVPNAHPDFLELVNKLTFWIDSVDDEEALGIHVRRAQALKDVSVREERDIDLGYWTAQAGAQLEKDGEDTASLPAPSHPPSPSAAVTATTATLDPGSPFFQDYVPDSEPDRLVTDPGVGEEFFQRLNSTFDFRPLSDDVRFPIQRTCGKKPNPTRTGDIKPAGRALIWRMFNAKAWFSPKLEEREKMRDVAYDANRALSDAIKATKAGEELVTIIQNLEAAMFEPEDVPGWLNPDEMRIEPLAVMLWWIALTTFALDPDVSGERKHLRDTLEAIGDTAQRFIIYVCQPIMRAFFDSDWEAVNISMLVWPTLTL
jgi:hypothetical protein